MGSSHILVFHGKEYKCKYHHSHIFQCHEKENSVSSKMHLEAKYSKDNILYNDKNEIFTTHTSFRLYHCKVEST